MVAASLCKGIEALISRQQCPFNIHWWWLVGALIYKFALENASDLNQL